MLLVRLFLFVLGIVITFFGLSVNPITPKISVTIFGVVVTLAGIFFQIIEFIMKGVEILLERFLPTRSKGQTDRFLLMTAGTDTST